MTSSHCDPDRHPRALARGAYRRQRGAGRGMISDDEYLEHIVADGTEFELPLE
jgi:hypothetical protein